MRLFSRRLFVGVLIYLALDLSLASMPGAFVFEPAESVEGVRMTRAQEAADRIASPTPAQGPRALLLPEITARWSFVPAPSIPRVLLHVRTGARYESPEATPSSEDPH